MSALRRFSWAVLGTLLAALLLGAAVYSRAGWTELVPGEGTVLMQAASVAHDFDLTYTRDDFERMTLLWGFEPSDLELATGSGGRRIAYDRPFPQALILAPFVRLAPQTGFAVANALLLALAALFAARVLETFVGDAAPLFVVLGLFGSIAFGEVFLANGAAFLLAVSVTAWSLVARIAAADGGLLDKKASIGTVWRWSLAAGALMAILVTSENLLWVLAVAAFFALPRGSSHRSGFAFGLFGAFFAIVAVQWWAGGGLLVFAAERFRFMPPTGFPLVDFPADDWTQTLHHLRAIYWDEAPRAAWGRDPLLWAWSGLYLLVGRHVGLLWTFLPAFFFLVTAGRDCWRSFRRPILLGAAAWMVGIVVLHPFNIFGGPGGLGNELFLPVYGALWMTAAGKTTPSRKTLVGLVVTLALAAHWVGGLWVGGLWTSPWQSARRAAQGPPLFASWSPFETSQRWLAGRPADHGSLRVLLNENVWHDAQRDLLRLDRETPRAELVVASPERLTSLALAFGPGVSADIQLGGARRGERVIAGAGGLAIEIEPWVPRRHAAWWTSERQWLYAFSFELPVELVPPGNADVGAVPFRVTGTVAGD